MIALVQRVKSASVTVDGVVHASIQSGMLILLGVHRDDGSEELEWVARKCAALRIFPDEDGKMNRSLADVGGQALVVSQFTLYGDVTRGNRPSFVAAGPPETARPLYEQFASTLGRLIGREVVTGVFGAMMDVSLVNDGPVTVSVERPPNPQTD